MTHGIDAPSLTCRLCGEPLTEPFADLGMTPLSNSYVRPADLHRMEAFYPLTAYVCSACFLVQLPVAAAPDRIFAEYPYLSSVADSFVAHARRYCRMIRERLGLDGRSLVIEVASNDGYLLQFFAADGIPAFGIDPAANAAAQARARGVETRVEFFGVASARGVAAEGRRADLLIANNVLAHVPDLNDFTAGLRLALKPSGTVTVEFPHLARLMAGLQFDTIYHEHLSYLSLATVRRLFAAHGLTVFDVEELPTHGGSLRLFARPAETGVEASPALARLDAEERAAGLGRLDTYRRFAARVPDVKRGLLRFLIAARDEGRRVAGYGAPAKSSTLLNYCGIRTDLLEYTVDRSPLKQGLFLPGTRIPIHDPEHVRKTRPDYLLILPWNLRDEIVEQMRDIHDWGGKFVVPIPRLEIIG
jgi:SAM-dependent methyltransferase